MKLYELVGKDKSQGFSPYVWRSKMALAHKGLEVERAPVIFTEIPKLTEVEARTVPILEDGGEYIVDSWRIACHLEENYPDKPSLFGGEMGRAQANLFQYVAVYTLLLPLFPALVHDIFLGIDDRDRDYFRKSREARLGKSLEEAAEQKHAALAAFQKQLRPYNATLKTQDFFCGAAPAYIDYIMYGLFQWARGVSALQLIGPDEPLYGWRGRMDGLFDGLGRTIIPRSDR